MQRMPDFVRDDTRVEEGTVRPASSANLTGWETVIFQVLEEPVLEEPEPESESALATAAIAP
jgi:hypothetical protein